LPQEHKGKTENELTGMKGINRIKAKEFVLKKAL
jgi:hypothetical protein